MYVNILYMNGLGTIARYFGTYYDSKLRSSKLIDLNMFITIFIPTYQMNSYDCSSLLHDQYIYIIYSTVEWDGASFIRPFPRTGSSRGRSPRAPRAPLATVATRRGVDTPVLQGMDTSVFHTSKSNRSMCRHVRDDSCGPVVPRLCGAVKD